MLLYYLHVLRETAWNYYDSKSLFSKKNKSIFHNSKITYYDIKILQFCIFELGIHEPLENPENLQACISHTSGQDIPQETSNCQLLPTEDSNCPKC